MIHSYTLLQNLSILVQRKAFILIRTVISFFIRYLVEKRNVFYTLRIIERQVSVENKIFIGSDNAIVRHDNFHFSHIYIYIHIRGCTV